MKANLRADEYVRRYLKPPAYGLWRGALDMDQFAESMETAVMRGIRQAWYDGLAEVGIKPSEMTIEERNALQVAMFDELSHVYDLAAFIDKNSRANGGKWATVLSRLQLWGNRARDIGNQAKLMAAGDPKLRWELGATEHCPSCEKLAGKVKRQSYWNARGIQPQHPPNPLLICQGWG